MTNPQVEAILTTAKEFVAKYEAKLDEVMAKYPTLTQYEKMKDVEEKTGYSKVYFFLALLAVLSLIIYIVGGTKLITDLFSFVYPAYMSFKAIDSPDSNQDIQWLTYWVVFAFFSIIESVASFLTDLIPFYFVIKLAFFIWLYHPKFLGAGVLYGQVLKPMLAPHMEALGVTSSDSKKDE
mmetsp:Transcript_2360/g.3464  ORF Transcript_2360/g.3464 Transcript_2360/m.3464 type:complete len:180 (+) Transcript_2360:64-603(+)